MMKMKMKEMKTTVRSAPDGSDNDKYEVCCLAVIITANMLRLEQYGRIDDVALR